VECLCQPATERLFRVADADHVSNLGKAIHDSKLGLISPLICHIPDPQTNNVTRKKLEDGIFILEVIGGNHTRIALQQGSVHKTCAIKLYSNLEDPQALYLAHEHNKAHESVKTTSFEDYARCFRQQLYIVLEKDCVDTELTKESKTKWKQHLVSILGLVVSTILLLASGLKQNV